MNKILTIINEKERTGRSYTFEFKTEEIKQQVQHLIFESKISGLDIGTIIHNIKQDKSLYNTLDYKIIGVDHAVDIIAIMIDKDNNKIKIPIIDRKYAPLGFALPGGFVEGNDTLIETAKKEFSEELKFNIDSEPTYITKFFEGKDENGILYDHRGEVTTQGFVFEIPFDSTLEAGDDAAKFKYLEFDINDGLDKILNQINKESFAMSRHKEILIESIENLDELKIQSLER